MKILIRKLMVFTLILITCTMIGIFAARLIGAAQRPNPASYIALLMSDIEQAGDVWCWRDVCPGRDSFEEAERKATDMTGGEAFRLVSNYDRMMLWESNDPTLWRVWLEAQATLTNIQRISIEPEPNIYRDFLKPNIGSKQMMLGDLMLRFGTPALVTGRDLTRTRNRVIVCFQRQVCAELLPAHRLSPTQWVDHIMLQGDIRQLYAGGRTDVRAWRGMVSVERLFDW